MRPNQVGELIQKREADANRIADSIVAKIKETMEAVVEAAVSRREFGNLGGELVFPIEHRYSLTADQMPFTRTSVTSYLEDEGWHVNKLQINEGSLDSPSEYLQVHVGLRSRKSMR